VSSIFRTFDFVTVQSDGWGNWCEKALNKTGSGAIFRGVIVRSKVRRCCLLSDVFKFLPAGCDDVMKSRCSAF